MNFAHNVLGLLEIVRWKQIIIIYFFEQAKKNFKHADNQVFLLFDDLINLILKSMSLTSCKLSNVKKKT